VKNNIQLFGLKKHTAIYPLVASLFMYQNPRYYPEEKILREIKSMSDEEYSKYIFFIHNQLKNDSNYKKRFRPEDLTMKAQKVWSSRLPASTTKEYVQICTALNRRSYFDSNTYGILAEILETLMENPANAQWLSHAGMKGGSTPFVLTKVLYATLKNGSKIELAYFFNNLNAQEIYKLQGWMNDFELKILMDDGFRKQLVF
jgi:D-alanyl-D-alanine carboxypeptidase